MSLRFHPGWLSAALFALYAAVLLPRQRVDNLVYFGGDSWEYQSMAVNYLNGNGMRAGRVLPLEAYRLSQPPETPALAAHFEETGRDPRRYHTYRTPGFPAFAALVYAAGGVQPRLVYRAQLLVLIAIAALLPWTAARAHGRAGLLAGAAAGAGLLAWHADVASTFLTETMIMLALYLLYLAGVLFQARPSPARAAALGLTAGAGLLVKGSLVFIPPLLGLWLLAGALRGRVTVPALLAAGLGMAALPLGWSAYVSAVEGRPVFISTQGNAVLLEGNNELCFADGGWHPEYDLRGRDWVSADPEEIRGLYYNRPDVRGQPVPVQLAGFAREHAARMPRLLLTKLGNAWADFPPLRVLALLLAGAALARAASARLPPRVALAAGACAALALHFLLPASSLAATGLLLLAGLAAGAWDDRRGEAWVRLDPLVWIVLLNFVALTLLVFGLRRFVLVADFLVLLALVLAAARLAPRVRAEWARGAR